MQTKINFSMYKIFCFPDFFIVIHTLKIEVTMLYHLHPTSFFISVPKISAPK